MKHLILALVIYLPTIITPQPVTSSCVAEIIGEDHWIEVCSSRGVTCRYEWQGGKLIAEECN